VVTITQTRCAKVGARRVRNGLCMPDAARYFGVSRRFSALRKGRGRWGVTSLASRRKHPSKVVTIHDVARHAGVSSMTVSRTINGERYVSPALREKVMASIKALDYSVNLAARNTRSGNTAPRIGILYSNPSSAYLNEIMLGGLQQSGRVDGQLLLETCAGLTSQKAALKKLLAAGIDGVVLPPPLCDSRATIAMLKAEKVPTLALATARPLDDISSVRIDDYQGALVMTRFLIGLGHKDIGFIKGDPSHTPAELRYVGFLAGMDEAGLKVNPDLVVPGMFTYRSGLAAGETLLKRPHRPTAIFASNDDMAAAVLAIAHGQGIKIPNDLTICGFDDTPVATTVWPTLTTIHQPIISLGRTAVAILAEQIQKLRKGEDAPPVHQLMKFTLMKRDSSAPPRAA
jgi:LacI family transcriptional regulator